MTAADPWAASSDRVALFSDLHADGLLDEVPCLACGYPTLSERGGDHICVVCLTLRQAVGHIAETGVFASRWFAVTAPEYFAPDVRAARADLVAAYERLRRDPRDTAVRAAVHAGRARFMRAIVTAMS
jgi:hypothetical protein